MERGKRVEVNPIDDWITLGYSLEEAEILEKLSAISEECNPVSYEELKAAMDRIIE
jgi:hypothetical protein